MGLRMWASGVLWRLLDDETDEPLPEPPKPVKPPEENVTKITITRQTKTGKTTFSTLYGEGPDLYTALRKALGRSKSGFRDLAEVLGRYDELAHEVVKDGDEAVA